MASQDPRERLAVVESEIADLEQQQARATQGGAAWNARHERLQYLYGDRETLRALLAADDSSGVAEMPAEKDAS